METCRTSSSVDTDSEPERDTMKVEIAESSYTPGYGLNKTEIRETKARIDRMIRERKRAEELMELPVDPPRRLVIYEGRSREQIEDDLSLRITSFKIDRLNELKAFLLSQTSQNKLETQAFLCSMQNPFVETVELILSNIRRGIQINVDDLDFYHLHKGYLYISNTIQIFDSIRRHMSLTDVLLPELATDTLTTDKTYCSCCTVKHTGQIILEQCETLRNFGRGLEVDLLYSRGNLTNPQAVYCIGTNILKYLPTVLQQYGWINAAVDSLGTYCVDGLELNQIDWSQASLAQQLYSKLKLLGLTSNTTVLIEFEVSPSNKSAKAIEHLWGFLLVLSFLQTKYWGCLVALFPPHVPKVTDTPKKYGECKQDKDIFGRTALILGQILGVAVHVCQIQTVLDQTTQEYARLPSWRSEPIFSKSMRFTREWYVRLSLDLRNLTCGLDKILVKYPGEF